MPLRLDIKKKLTVRSDRVKSVEMHPTEPWVLCALYSGKVQILQHSGASGGGSGPVWKTFDVSDQPVRCARWIARKQWFVAGSDDMRLSCFSYHTGERLASWEAHQDYLRFLEPHPTLPLLLSTSDDMTARLWDWEKGASSGGAASAGGGGSGGSWALVQTFEGHAHYCMQARFNPKDPSSFATASLDRSVKVWSLSSPSPNFSLEGHERGVNCLAYYSGGDKPFLVSGADDFTLRLWDLQTRSCVAVLEGHQGNVCAAAFHPRLPLIISGSEDGTVRLWSSSTYRPEATLSYGFERCWAVAVAPGGASGQGASNKVALGFDDGTIVLKLGKESPVASMDKNGKIILARNNVIHTASVRTSASSAGLEDETGEGSTAIVPAAASAPSPPPVDGEPMSVAERELTSVEIFPSSVQHNANGRFVAIVGDGEFVVYTAQALRNKTFGPALDFVWSAFGTGDFAVRESPSRVKVYRNFKETHAFRPLVSAEGLSGGALLGVRAADTLLFYDWESDRVVRRIEVAAKAVYWNESGELVAIAAEDSFFVLRFNREAYLSALAAAAPGSQEAAVFADEGVEAAFELQHALEGERVRSGTWVGDCFVFVTGGSGGSGGAGGGAGSGGSTLRYYVGGEVITLAHLQRPLYLLGYLPKEGRVFLMDKTGAIVSYSLLLALLEYQTAVVRRDFAAANKILAEVPREHHNKIARFLDSQGFKNEALAVAEDPDLKFDLSVQLGKLDTAYALLKDQQQQSIAAGVEEDADAASKWRTLMDLALARSNLSLAEECALAARDVSGLLLLYTSTGNAAGIEKLVTMAKEDGRANIAFLALHTLGRVEEATHLLADTGRTAEAVFFARTYCPSLVPSLMPQWKSEVSKHSRRGPASAESLAEPAEHPEMFPDWDVALKAEAMVNARRSAALARGGSLYPPAEAYPQAKADLDVDVIAVVKQMLASGRDISLAPSPAPAPAPAASASSSTSSSTGGAGAAAAPQAAPSPKHHHHRQHEEEEDEEEHRHSASSSSSSASSSAPSVSAPAAVAPRSPREEPPAPAPAPAPVVATRAAVEAAPAAVAPPPVPAPLAPAAPAVVEDDGLEGLEEFEDAVPPSSSSSSSSSSAAPAPAPAVVKAAAPAPAPAPAPAAGADDELDFDESDWS